VTAFINVTNLSCSVGLRWMQTERTRTDQPAVRVDDGMEKWRMDRQRVDRSGCTVFGEWDGVLCPSLYMHAL
jgi:hypothetical protein